MTEARVAGPLEAEGAGVRRVRVPSPTLPPAKDTNAWVLGDRDVIVVDPGCPWPATQASLAARLDGLRVVAVFLTHHHIDHASGALDLCARTSAPLWSHATTGERANLSLDRCIAPGEVLSTDAGDWTTVLTPGHADGHLCLHNGETGDVVAGDMVAGEGTILLAPPDADLAAYLTSLQRLRDLSPRRLLPAHGPALAPALPVLDEYIAHRHARTAQVLGCLSAGPLTALQIAREVYPDLPAHFLGFAAVQVQAHLDWLLHRAHVQSVDSEHYAIPGA